MNLKISLRELGTTTQAAVAKTHGTMARWHAGLSTNNLVVQTAGDMSQRVTDTELLVIKPSGVHYDKLTADSMVICDLEGNKIADSTTETLQPSLNMVTRTYVYRHLPQVGRVIHIHSPYAMAFMTVCQPIPCVLTMIADEFGEGIPVEPFVVTGDNSIGRDVVEILRESRSPTVLTGDHGPFIVGRDVKATVRAAIMMEKIARTVTFTKSLETPYPIGPTTVDALWQWRQNAYGQPES